MNLINALEQITEREIDFINFCISLIKEQQRETAAASFSHYGFLFAGNARTDTLFSSILSLKITSLFQQKCKGVVFFLLQSKKQTSVVLSLTNRILSLPSVVLSRKKTVLKIDPKAWKCIFVKINNAYEYYFDIVSRSFANHGFIFQIISFPCRSTNQKNVYKWQINPIPSKASSLMIQLLGLTPPLL